MNNAADTNNKTAFYGSPSSGSGYSLPALAPKPEPQVNIAPQPSALEQLQSVAQSPAGYGIGSAGASALLAAALSKKKNRLRNAAIGGAAGLGLGLGAHALLNRKTAAVKQALIGTAIGAIGGAATGDKGKKVRAATRGALKGLGTDIGMGVGGVSGAALGGLGGAIATLPMAGIGAIPGAVIGGLGGTYAGGRLGYDVANSMLGPYKSKREEMLELLQEIEAHRQATDGASKAAGDKTHSTQDVKMKTEKKAAGWPKFIENANDWLQNATATSNAAGRVNYHNLAALGAGLGAVSGAFTAPKGKMLKRTLQGAGVGGVMGLGAGLGGQMGYNIIGDHPPYANKKLIPAGLAFGGGMLGHHLADKALNEVTDDTETGDYQRALEAKKKKQEEDSDIADIRAGLAKISAWNDYITSPLAQGATMGGAGGAMAGGLAGLIAPGEEETVDEFGRPVRKQRNRFGAAVRGLIGGGLAGAAGGAAAGHFAPGATSNAFNTANQYANTGMDYMQSGLNHVQNYGKQMAQQLGFGGKQLPQTSVGG